MTLSDEIRFLIDKITPRSGQDEETSLRRWLNLSGEAQDAVHEYLPLIVMGYDRNNPDETKNLWPGHIRYSLEERMDNPEKMLFEQLVQMVPARRFPSDATTCIMPMYGNAFLLSALGLETVVIEDTHEPARSLTREESRHLELAGDISKTRYIRKAMDFLHYAQSVLPPHIQTALCFLMSPYDLAYLIRGEGLMVDMYESSEDVHHVLEICSSLFIQATELLKREAHEPKTFFRYGNRTYRGGNMLCEDCCVMLSPELHRDFSIPYTRKALDALGGGWVHFCGNGSHILENYFSIPNMHGIQYGQSELNGDIEKLIRNHVLHRKGLHINPPRNEDEDFPAYFKRIFGMIRARKYVDLTVSVTSDDKDGGRLMEMWHEAQDAGAIIPGGYIEGNDERIHYNKN